MSAENQRLQKVVHPREFYAVYATLELTVRESRAQRDCWWFEVSDKDWDGIGPIKSESSFEGSDEQAKTAAIEWFRGVCGGLRHIAEQALDELDFDCKELRSPVGVAPREGG
jgi:hypothetical protein